MQLIQKLSPYIATISLDRHAVFCGDDRSSDLDLYIHWFGGIINPIFNDAVLSENDQPGSVNDTLKQLVRIKVPEYRDVAKVKGGIHSDEQTEGSKDIRTDILEGPIGCGYLFKRSAISGLLYTQREPIVTDLQRLLPEYFENDQDIEYAYDITKAHNRLAQRIGFMSPGREIGLEAIRQGALTMNVREGHASKQGVLNTDASVSLQTSKALAAGLATYWHDLGSVEQAQARISHNFTHKQHLIANALDAVATMRALGVEYIEVNRTTKVP